MATNALSIRRVRCLSSNWLARPNRGKRHTEKLWNPHLENKGPFCFTNRSLRR
jgi:hypothetical protein